MKGSVFWGRVSIVIAALTGPVCWQWPAASALAQSEADGAGGTIVYGRDFFAQYPNAVSALDLVRRIPAGARILAASQSQGERGFSGNTDLILIDGKRITGKSNSSENVLERISVDQLARIEVIRGSSPDIKVISQESILNVVLKETAGGANVSWSLDGLVLPGAGPEFGVSLSYGAKRGGFDYLLSGEIDRRDRRQRQTEDFFLGGGNFDRRLRERIDIDNTEYELAANIGYSAGSGALFNLNGQFEKETGPVLLFDGALFLPGADGRLIPGGDSRRLLDNRETEWEIGADIDIPVTKRLRAKILALRSEEDFDFSQQEDRLIEGERPLDDFLFLSADRAKETIARAALEWQASAAHDLEFGTEFAFNELRSRLQLFELEENRLVEREIPQSDVLVAEDRNETFLIHNWRAANKLNFQTSLFVESFAISQDSAETASKRRFTFFRPGTEARFDATGKDQIRVSIAREVEQFDFDNFASSVSEDDEIVGGNEALVPEKRWVFEAGYERRLPDDGGRIKPFATLRLFEDRIERVEVLPGISGVGNIGDAWQAVIGIEASIRAAFWNLPGLLIEPEFRYRFSRVDDPFTGERRRLSFETLWRAQIGLQHDVKRLNFTYEIDLKYFGPIAFQDINERQRTGSAVFLDIAVEKTVYRGIVARLSGHNLIDRRERRVRDLFADGIAGGVLTRRVIRDRHFGRRFMFTLKGNF